MEAGESTMSYRKRHWKVLMSIYLLLVAMSATGKFNFSDLFNFYILIEWVIENRFCILDVLFSVDFLMVLVLICWITFWMYSKLIYCLLYLLEMKLKQSFPLYNLISHHIIIQMCKIQCKQYIKIIQYKLQVNL